MNPEEINAEIGNIDLFLLDQILKGRFLKDQKILDAGCGEGRNLLYFLKNGYDISAIDQNESAIKMIRMHAHTLGATISPDQLLVGDVTQIPFPSDHFHVVNCLSVLHFAENEKVFLNMMMELSRVLRPGGILILKMDTLMGMESTVSELEQGIFQLSDGSLRFLLQEDIINRLTSNMNYELVEPLKCEIINRDKSIAFLVLKLKDL